MFSHDVLYNKNRGPYCDLKFTMRRICMMSSIRSFDELPVMLQASHVKRVLELSTGKTYQLMHSEGFPTQYFGKRVMVLKSDFLDWLEQNKTNSTRE